MRAILPIAAAIVGSLGLLALWFVTVQRAALDSRPITSATETQPISVAPAATGTEYRDTTAKPVPSVRGNLFASTPAEQAAKETVPVAIEPASTTSPSAGPELRYTGTVTLRGRKMALIEIPGTNVGRYVSVGDRVAGASIRGVTDRFVTLRSNGRSLRLEKNENYRFAPLSRSAPFMTEVKPAEAKSPPAAQNPQPQSSQDQSTGLSETAAAALDAAAQPEVMRSNAEAARAEADMQRAAAELSLRSYVYEPSVPTARYPVFTPYPSVTPYPPVAPSQFYFQWPFFQFRWPGW